MQDTQAQKIAKLMALKTAPKGKVAADFKAALYVMACLYQMDFTQTRNLGMCAHLLGSVGYKGDLSECTKEKIEKTLKELVQENALVSFGSSNAYASPSQIKTLCSKVKALEVPNSFNSGKSYCFLIADEEGNEYKLKTNLVILPHDEVEALCVEGADVAYVSRLTKKRQCILGRIQFLGGKSGRTAVIVPDEPNLKSVVFELESESALNGASSGDAVIAQIVKRCATKCLVAVRQVVRNLGDLNSIIVMAVLRNDIPCTWPENLLKSLNKIPSEVRDEDRIGRVDLRELPLVTIDGEDARDFDDAVYCRKEGDKWRLYVAIADVSTYVKPNTLLDREAQLRCNSCYFPNYVVPMLPEKLSNGICSLNPGVDRLCMVCQMLINKAGKTEEYDFYPAVMRSHARLTYTEAWKMIQEGKAEYEEHAGSIGDVRELYGLYKVLDKARVQRGGLSIESKEMHFVFDENMEITGLSPIVRNDAHKLIEECMIAANVAAATFVSEKKYQTLYRVHARPSDQKLELLTQQLSRLGLSLTGGEKPSPKDFQKLADAVQGREDAELIGELILRSMSKAEYSPDNIGHFGLALDKYAHFTSPIRRYADLQLHRVIKYILEKEQKRQWGRIGAKAYTKADLASLGVKCTERELNADNAEREVDAELSCVFMEKFIGKTIKGTVTACTRFGVFVRLDDFGIDGMIYIGNFPSYMKFDERTQTLVSDKNEVYAVGKKLEVLVAAVNRDEHKIDLLPKYAGNSIKLKKQRNKLLEKRAASRENAQPVDKDELLNSLADISRAKQADSSDQVVRKFNDDIDWSDIAGLAHYDSPIKMPKPYGESKKKSKKK